MMEQEPMIVVNSQQETPTRDIAEESEWSDITVDSDEFIDLTPKDHPNGKDKHETTDKNEAPQ